MSDLQIARENLSGHTICLCRDGKLIISDKRGISPMMSLIAEGADLCGYSVADLIVGKAVAMLFVKCNIKEVYAKTMSVGGRDMLAAHSIPCEYETLTERIINRDGTDICPMEKTVQNTDDIEEGYNLLKTKLQSLMKPKDGN